MAARGGADVRELLLQVDASVELARRNLGQLANQVAVDSAKMDASLARVDGAADRLGGIFTKVSNLAAGFGLSLGVGAVISFGRNILQMGDDIEAAADQAGMSAEQYQVMRQSLRALEVQGESADKIFKVLSATLGDVQNGADNAATQALGRLSEEADGLSIKARILNGEIDSTDELLDALAKASRNAGSEAQFTADIVDIVGRKIGVDLAAAIGNGGVAWEKMKEDVRSAGTVLDEEMLARLANANETIDRFFESTSYYAAIWSANMIKAFRSVAMAMTLGPEVFWREPSKSANQKALSSAMANQRRAQQRAMGGEDYTASRDLASANREVARLRAAVASEQPAGAPPAPPPPAPRFGRAASGGAKPRKARGGGKPKKPDLSRRSLSSLEEGLPAWQRLDDSAPNTILSAEVDWDRMVESAQELRDLLVEQGELDPLRTLRESLDSMPPLPDLGKMLSVEEQERIDNFIADFQRDLAGGLADAIVNGEDLGEVLEDSFKRAAAALIESGLIELLQQLAGAFGFGSSGSGGEGDLISALFKSIGKRAAGGPVSARTPYLVGERGPELFVPKIPGRIVPNHALGAGGSRERIDVFVHHDDEMLQVKIARTAGIVVHQAAPGIADRAAARTFTALTRRGLPSGL